jgi:hypothetical protein
MKIAGRIFAMIMASVLSVLAVRYFLRRFHRYWHRRVLIMKEDYGYDE